MWIQNFWQATKTLNFLRTSVITTIVVITIAMSMLKAPAIDTTLVRKNVVDLTSQEKADFVNAIKTLKNTYPEGSEVSKYDQFVATHMGAMAMMSKDSTGPAAMIDVAHGNDGFLPWHREYLNPYLPVLASNDIVTPADTLDFRKYRSTYDTLVTSDPQPNSKFRGVFPMFGMGYLFRPDTQHPTPHTLFSVRN